MEGTDLSEELALLKEFGDKELFDLCVALDFVPDGSPSVEELLPRLLEALAASLASRQPVPITKWDAKELQQLLSPEQVGALARHIGVRRSTGSPDAVLSRVVRTSQRRCRNLPTTNPLWWFAPILLPAAARLLVGGRPDELSPSA
jgi:hypothetical protein